MPDDPSSAAHDAREPPEQIPALLGRIERQLARIADALEAMTSAPVNFTKDLGPTRTMPKPQRR
jgi:hypothetical protein